MGARHSVADHIHSRPVTPRLEPHTPAPHHRLAHLVWQGVWGLGPGCLQAPLLQLREELAPDQRPGVGEKTWVWGDLPSPTGPRVSQWQAHAQTTPSPCHAKTHTNTHVCVHRLMQAPTRAQWGHCSAGSGGRTVPPGGHRRPRRGPGRAALAKESGERTHAGQGR